MYDGTDVEMGMPLRQNWHVLLGRDPMREIGPTSESIVPFLAK